MESKEILMAEMAEKKYTPGSDPGTCPRKYSLEYLPEIINRREQQDCSI
jgi:hypothetical protein